MLLESNRPFGRLKAERMRMADIDFQNLPSFHPTDEILAHPRFPFARDEFVKAMLALYEHKPFLNRLLLEASRTVLVAIIMCLHARYDEADRATWPTLRLVADAMAEHQLASPSRVQDLVSRFVKTGYLEQRPAPLDRRVRILTPTAKMITQDQDFLVSHHLPLQILFPDPGYELIMTRDPAFQVRQRLVSRDLFALGAQILASNPVMMLFQGRDAGVMILIKMIEMGGGQGGAAEDFLLRPRRPLRRIAHPCPRAARGGGTDGACSPDQRRWPVSRAAAARPAGFRPSRCGCHEWVRSLLSVGASGACVTFSWSCVFRSELAGRDTRKDSSDIGALFPIVGKCSVGGPFTPA
jgi:DNA-binding MarR family transcriptional regulator